MGNKTSRTVTVTAALMAALVCAAATLYAFLGREKKGLFDDGAHLIFIGSALKQYGTEKGKLPDDIRDKNGKLLLSWRVAILPYFATVRDEEQYKKFHLDEPWDSPHNLAVAQEIPERYRDPRGSRFTPYLAVTGEKAAFRPGNPRPWTSKTTWGVMVVTAKSGVFWTEPRDISIEEAQKPDNLQWVSSRPFGLGPYRTDYLGPTIQPWGWGRGLPKPCFEPK